MIDEQVTTDMESRGASWRPTTIMDTTKTRATITRPKAPTRAPILVTRRTYQPTDQPTQIIAAPK